MILTNFDSWSIVFLFFSGLGLLTSILVQFQTRQNRFGRNIISLVLLFFSLTLFDYVIFWTKNQINFPYFIGISSLFYFLYGPMLYIYVEQAEKKFFTNISLLHFFPFTIFLITCLPFFFQPLIDKISLIETGKIENIFYYYLLNFINWASIVHLFVYSYLIYKKRILASEFNGIKMWILLLAGSLFGIALSYLTYYVLVIVGVLTIEMDYMISIAISLFVLSITILGFLRPNTFDDLINLKLLLKPENNKYKSSPLNPKMIIEIADKINSEMENKHLWQKSDLRLDELASSLNFPKQYISQVINEHYKMNFFEFINSYRIKEAKIIIENNIADSKLIEIAYQVGFNNKVSFAKAFKFFNGQTPQDFQKQINKSLLFDSND